MAKDYGDRFADDAQKRLEDKIRAIYEEAEKDVSRKIDKYTKNYEKKEKEYQQKVKDGKMTQKQFDDWKRHQVFLGKRWNDVRNDISAQMYGARETSTRMINDERKAVFVQNVNFSEYNIDKDFRFGLSFNVYDSATVTKLMKEDPKLLPDLAKPDKTKDYDWSRRQISNAITQGVIQGESIPQISDRIAGKLGSNAESVTSLARTAMTSAQNSGRLEAMHNAQDMGIVVEKMWIATLDNRTREAHADLDGQTAKVDDPFHSILGDIMYPADPNASAENVWNCRCSLGWEYPEYKNQYDTRADREYDGEDDEVGHTVEVPHMTYKEWSLLKATEQAESNTNYKALKESDVESVFGQRPERALRRSEPEEYQRKRDEYDRSSFKMWYDNLSDKQVSSIADYSSDNYLAINGLCRGQLTEKMARRWDITSNMPVEEEVKNIEDAISKFDLKENIKVYRTCERDVLNSIRIGSQFKDNGFTSSSIFQDPVASGTVDIEINVPAGHGRGAWIKPISGSPDENEFLIQRGSLYDVVDMKEKDGRTKIVMDWVGVDADEIKYATKEQVLQQWKEKGISFTEEDADKI